MAGQERETNRFIEWLLCLTLGYLGIHKFYAGKKKMGIIYLFTAGLCGIGWIVDLIALTVELLPRRDSGQKASQLSENRTLTEENFSAVGVCYYESNIRKLACKNAEWSSRSSQILSAGKAGRRIFKNYYINKPVKLVLEDDNANDPNAVAIMVAGELVGYISRAENERVREILNSREIIFISAFIGGGEYKIVTDEGETVHDCSDHSINVRIRYI